MFGELEWRERVPDCSSCDAETASGRMKWESEPALINALTRS